MSRPTKPERAEPPGHQYRIWKTREYCVFLDARSAPPHTNKVVTVNESGRQVGLTFWSSDRALAQLVLLDIVRQIDAAGYLSDAYVALVIHAAIAERFHREDNDCYLTKEDASWW